MYRTLKDRTEKKTQSQASKVRDIYRNQRNNLPLEEKYLLDKDINPNDLAAYNKIREQGHNKDWYTKTRPRTKHSRRNQHPEYAYYSRKGNNLVADSEQVDHTTLPYKYRNPVTKTEEKIRDPKVRATKID